MTVIDKYIFNNPGRSADKLAQELGISETFVECRRLALKASEVVVTPLSTSEEIHALINLINVRKEGWAVDVARARIHRLDALARK